jgi:hypothetical protein
VLFRSRQCNVVVVPDATLTMLGPLAGVPPINVTASYYFWNQVKGPCAVKCRGTLVVGNTVIADWTTTSGSAGSVIPMASGTNNSIADVIKGGFIGTVERVNATLTYAWINLMIPGY